MYLFHYFKWNRGATYDSEDTHMKNISPRSHTIKVRVKKKKQTNIRVRPRVFAFFFDCYSFH